MLNGTEVSKGIGIGPAKVLASAKGGEILTDKNFAESINGIKPGSVLVVAHMTTYMVALLKDMSIAAIVSEAGGMTSHSALVAKSMGIPAVYGVSDVMRTISDGDMVIVDGIGGYVYCNPDKELIDEFTARRKSFLKDRDELEKYRSMKTVMADGHTPEIFCNVNDVFGTMKAIDNGGEGIGLFRTENLFFEKEKMPDEEEQTRAYSRIIRAMDGREVVIRTLDIGGDKVLPYLEQKVEANPFLGYRAIRYSLGNRELFIPQLRAILRASAEGKVLIMIPMITCVEEMRSVRSLIYEVKSDLRDEGYDFDDDIRIGAMIETPSAAICSDLLATECDFFSIGSNDLVQYTMCADRCNSEVAYLQSVTQPSVLRLIKKTIDSAKNAQIPVSICGEAGADPALIPMLVGLGCDRFSVNPLSVPEVRRTLSRWTVEEAREAAEEIMNMTVDFEVREYIKNMSREKI